MIPINPIRELPSLDNYSEGDYLVIFGEVFERGYINGLISAAKKKNMKVIYTTVGRRDSNGLLQPLNRDELSSKQQTPLINIPLEAGFDMDFAEDNTTPCSQLSGVKLSEWKDKKLNWESVNQSKAKGEARFNSTVEAYVRNLEDILPNDCNILFAHTMAGGVPRTKIVMPLMNKVFKGHGDRYLSSKEFWDSDIGQLCKMTFESVTADTLAVLLDKTESLRKQQKLNGKKVSYVAYGYHGTELNILDKYTWQSYSPYLQGFAKLKLESIAKRYSDEGIQVSVFNAPEILTNSSSIFLGIEVALYPLLSAIKKEGLKTNPSLVNKLFVQSETYLKPEFKIDDVFAKTDSFYASNTIKNNWSFFEQWPQHNGPDQMTIMRETSEAILEMHIDKKNMMTNVLSEIVFDACGHLMLNFSYSNPDPVYWVGHDIVAKYFLQYSEI